MVGDQGLIGRIIVPGPRRIDVGEFDQDKAVVTYRSGQGFHDGRAHDEFAAMDGSGWSGGLGIGGQFLGVLDLYMHGDVSGHSFVSLLLFDDFPIGILQDNPAIAKFVKITALDGDLLSRRRGARQQPF